MEWLGQYIQAYKARFRNEVYLEDLTTTTETSVLVVDSNGLVSKSTSVAGDLTSIVAGTGLSGTSLTGPIPTLNVDASQTQITSVGTIGAGVWQGTTIKTAYIGDDQVTEDKLADTLLAEIDANTAKATNVTTNLTATTHASQITINSSDGTNVIVAEASGSIAGVMSVDHHDKLDDIENSATADQSKSDIDGLAITTVGAVSSGSWRADVIVNAYLDTDTAHLTTDQTFTGAKTFGKPLVSDGDRTLASGDGAAIHVDVFDVTDGTTSADSTTASFAHVMIENPRLLATNSGVTTTDASTLYIKGPPVASTNQTITNAYALLVDGGNVKCDGDLIVGGDIDLEGDIDVNGTLETDALTVGGTNVLTGSLITTLGTISAGLWNGDAIASAYLDADTAHLTTAQTFTGSKTMATNVKLNFRDANSYIHSNAANDLAIVATDVEIAATNIILDGDTSIALEGETTVTGSATIDGDALFISSSTASKPLVTIKNTTNDAGSGALLFSKDRGAAAVNNDQIGAMNFIGENDAQEATAYAQITVRALEVDDTDEAGEISFKVAESNGTTSGLTTGLIIEGSDNTTDGEVNVTIAAGAASTTTIAGNLNVSGSARSKQLQYISANWKGNYGTNEVFIPLSGQPEEKTTGPQEQVLVIMPTAGHVKEIICRTHMSTAGSNNIIWKVYTRDNTLKANGVNQQGDDISMTAPTQIGSGDATNTVTTGNLGTSYPYEEYDLLGVSMTFDAVGTANNNDRVYVTVVLENDYSSIGY